MSGWSALCRPIAERTVERSGDYKGFVEDHVRDGVQVTFEHSNQSQFHIPLFEELVFAS